MSARYDALHLLTFAEGLLGAAGLPADRARAVAEILVEADLLGHTTHGLDMLAAYLRELDAGHMARTGEPTVVNDSGAVFAWDGHRLPGPWLVRRAIAEARARMPMQPVVTAVIRHSHHIGCLQAYLKPVTDAGLLILLLTSDPAGKGVAPFGSIASCLTPNPLAAGIPTTGDPILIDISMSTTTNAMVKRVATAGGRLPGRWLVDAQGEATDDPASIGPEGGAILPIGGTDLGHKGFALALLVEALTSGLAGSGRADAPVGWRASVFLQVIDPDAFGGREAFVRESAFVADLCRRAAVPPGRPDVRLPGDGALARRRSALRDGVPLDPAILDALAPWAERAGLARPVSRPASS